MSFKIYCGSRIENLAEKLKDCLLKDRHGGDPFVFTKVVVPNGNLAKWLQIRMFAKEPDLCAGIQFPFMEKELTELMMAGLPTEERAEVELLPDHAYAKAIVSILLAGPEEQEEEQKEYAKLAPFRKYIMNSDSADAVAVTEQKQAAMTWQLADKLADLMDSYEVYRPEIVDWWLKGGKCPYDLRKGRPPMRRPRWRVRCGARRESSSRMASGCRCGNCITVSRTTPRPKSQRQSTSSDSQRFLVCRRRFWSGWRRRTMSWCSTAIPAASSGAISRRRTRNARRCSA